MWKDLAGRRRGLAADVEEKLDADAESRGHLDLFECLGEVQQDVGPVWLHWVVRCD